MMVLLIRLAVLLTASTMIPVHAQEVYTLLRGNENEDEVFHITDELNQRSLQDVTSACTTVGTRLLCLLNHGFDSENSVQVGLSCTTDAGKDFRSASSCTCTAQVTNIVIGDHILTKPCSCSVCPSGFGRSPISIDCTDTGDVGAGAGNVIPGCSSVDCNRFSCNGACVSEDVCDVDASSCPLCTGGTCGGNAGSLFNRQCGGK
jgi:hypothetical protein